MLDIENIIVKTKNFVICTINKPHIDRKEGGHIVIASRVNQYASIEDMPQYILHEFIDISSICGKYMKNMFAEEKIEVDIINYQINGNWSALNEVRDSVHMHLYGRAKQAIIQPYGSAVFLPDFVTGFYDKNVGLNMDEIMYLREKLLSDKTIQSYLMNED